MRCFSCDTSYDVIAAAFKAHGQDKPTNLSSNLWGTIFSWSFALDFGQLILWKLTTGSFGTWVIIFEESPGWQWSVAGLPVTCHWAASDLLMGRHCYGLMDRLKKTVTPGLIGHQICHRPGMSMGWLRTTKCISLRSIAFDHRWLSGVKYCVNIYIYNVYFMML